MMETIAKRWPPGRGSCLTGFLSAQLLSFLVRSSLPTETWTAYIAASLKPVLSDKAMLLCYGPCEVMFFLLEQKLTLSDLVTNNPLIVALYVL